MARVTTIVPCKVSLKMNVTLTKPFSQEEVKVTLFHMSTLQALGPDGFPARFFQHHWEVFGKDVTRILLHIVEGTESAKTINDTVLVLIPKVSSTTSLS